MRDFTGISRSAWIGLARGFYSRLFSEIAKLGPSVWPRPTPYLGWTAHDVLAHMASSVPVNFREVVGRALEGDPTAPAEYDTFQRNARAVRERRSCTPATLLAELEREVQSLLEMFESMSDEDWLRPAWFFIGPVRVRSLFLILLGDDVFHERDLLLAAGTWRGLDPVLLDPLVDWFLREHRTANFRPDRAGNLSTTVRYSLTGAGGGTWTLRIERGVSTVTENDIGQADVVVEADTEDLISVGLARTAPWVGRAGRWAAGFVPTASREDFLARITGMGSLAIALMGRRVRITGNPDITRRLNECFWHFWERTEQTAENIRRSSSTTRSQRGPNDFVGA